MVLATGAPTPEEVLDGRRRRSHDSRARIVAAMLELIREGDVSPGAEQVALRAKVGLRTVFRHFNDMESLYGEMSAAIEMEIAALVERPFKAADWPGRLQELVERRAYGYEKIAPYKRASDVHRHGSRFLQAAHERLAERSRAILKAQLPSDVAKDALLFEALDLLFSYEAWSRLRREQGLTPKRAQATLSAMLTAVIDPLLRRAPDRLSD